MEKSELQALVAGKSAADIAEMVNQNSMLAEAILDDPEFFGSIGSGSAATESVLPPSGASQQSGDEDVVEMVELRKSDLGDYAKNRSLKDAVAEVIKGKQHADKTINYLKSHLVPLVEKENAQLKSQMAEIQRRLQDMEKEKTSPQGGLSAPDANIELSDDEIANADLYDSDVQAKFKAALLKMKKPAAATKPETAVPRVEQYHSTTSARDEFDEITTFINHPDYVDEFGPMDVRSSNEKYLQFMSGLAGLAGLPVQTAADLVDAKGNLKQEVVNAVTQYNDPNSMVYKVAQERGITPPADMDKLQEVYKIRAVRNRYPGMSYEEAARFHFAGRPGPVASSNKMAEALARREERASPPQSAVVGVGAMTVNQAQVDLLHRKPTKDWTSAERAIMRSYYHQNGISPEEFDKIYESE